ncbi:MAG: class I SAM-dependent methyltransferase [Myxococcota bacterium]
MTSTQAEIDRSYSVSNDFFRLWLDENMHYTSAAWDREEWSLEEAQENKLRVLYGYAELDADKTVLDIGCGWGSAIECCVRYGIKEAHGITLSTEQLAYCHDRGLPEAKAKFWLQDYALYQPPFKYDGLISIEMIDHLCSPAQARQGLAVELYRKYFDTLAQWVEPGAAFGFQAILRNRIPRNRKDLEDLAFTADVIFPGGLNPRIEELVQAISPSWELEVLTMRRKDYLKTTAEWHRRLQLHERTIRSTWGDQVYDDYDRYLATCVRGFTNHWSGDVQMKLRRI